MAVITMPKMSDTMEEGTIVRWLKHEGENVSEGEAVAEIETDKANVEMESFEPGVISHILVKEGETVPIGTPIAEVAAPETAAASMETPEHGPQPEQPEIPCTAAPCPGTTDQVPLVTAPPPPEAVAPAPETKPEKQPAAAEVESGRIKASPLARRIAEEHGIDLSQIRGSGPDGRIVEEDVNNAIRQTQPAAPPPPAPAPQPAAPAQAAPSAVGPTEEHELSKMRKTIAERMTKSKQSIPHFYVVSEIEMDWAARVRDELNSDESQVKVSFTDMIIKACALALTKFPNVNASYAEDKLIIHDDINIGMAVALDDGLVAPVVHNADKKSLREIAALTKELAKRARENTLHSTDYMGGTFTVTNLGMFDVENFVAIINPPESAILAIGGIREVPVVIDEQVAVSKRMKVTLSADHRVLDGAVAARFLQEFKKRLESAIGLL